MSRFKKDFSKEQMYSKIMPSAAAPSAALPVEPPAKTENTVPAHAASATSPGFLLANLMEKLVLEKIDHTMKMLRCCQCERCRKDVLAVALNHLPPVYAVVPNTEEGRQKKLNGEYEVKAVAALIKAVQLVKTHPRHDVQGAMPVSD